MSMERRLYNIIHTKVNRMGNIFTTIAAFWRSEFVNDNKWIIVFLIVFCILATEFVCSMFFTHVILPRKSNVTRYLMPNYRNALAEIETLKADNIKLKEELEKYRTEKG